MLQSTGQSVSSASGTNAGQIQPNVTQHKTSVNSTRLQSNETSIIDSMISYLPRRLSSSFDSKLQVKSENEGKDTPHVQDKAENFITKRLSRGSLGKFLAPHQPLGSTAADKDHRQGDEEYRLTPTNAKLPQNISELPTQNQRQGQIQSEDKEPVSKVPVGLFSRPWGSFKERFKKSSLFPDPTSDKPNQRFAAFSAKSFFYKPSNSGDSIKELNSPCDSQNSQNVA